MPEVNEIMEKIIIAVDAMGGDNAPGCVIDGVVTALKAYDDIFVRLFGDEEKIKKELEGKVYDNARLEIIHSEEEITMHDEPMMAVRRKTKSSMVMGLMDVKEKRAHAFVSAGSTGALFLGGMAYVRLVKGIDRPALAPVLPGLKKPFLLIDSGANADCQPKYLMQFGLMGSVYMNKVMGVENPNVGLVNIGAEEEKGNKLHKEAYQLMKNQSVYTFGGNCEARDIQVGDFDVVATDGFTGNVILKYAEGLTKVLFKQIKSGVMETMRGKLGGAMLKPVFGKIKDKMNPDEYGGAPLLGLDGAVVKAHGSSNGYAFSRAVLQARTMVLGDIVGTIKKGLNDISKNQEA